METKPEKSPFTSQYERVNTKASVKGIVTPDITVKFENTEVTTVIRYDKTLEFEVSGTENQRVVERSFQLLKEWHFSSTNSSGQCGIPTFTQTQREKSDVDDVDLLLFFFHLLA